MRQLLVIALFLNAALLAVRALQETHPATVDAQSVPDEIILDNGRPGTSFKGSWIKSSGPNPFGTESLYNSVAGNWYVWEFSSSVIDSQSSYDVYAWWTSLPSRNPAATYELIDGQRIQKDQRVNGGKWNLLGRVSNRAFINVALLTSGSFSHSADAIRVVRIPPPKPELTWEEKQILSYFSVSPKNFTDCDGDEPGEVCYTPVVRIDASVHITGPDTEPRVLLVGSDAVLPPGDDWPYNGARLEGRVVENYVAP
jgi:hypothetical protein